MPRLPVDGKKVIEYRHTLGGVEREALKSLVLSYRIESLAGENGIIDELGSVDNIIGKLATVGFLLELFGITDVFDFDDKAIAKAKEIKNKIVQNEKDAVAANKARADAENQAVKDLVFGSEENRQLKQDVADAQNQAVLNAINRVFGRFL